MTADEAAVQRKGELLKKLAPLGQEHLLAFWDELTAVEREQLGRQIDEIDARLFRELQAEFRGHEAAGRDEKSKWADLAARAESPPALRLDGSGASFSAGEARDRGAAALAAGEVGMILVAGGLGTRLGFDQPKGLFELGPLSNRTLFQILFESLQAVGRRYGKSVPLYIMTSPATDEVTRRFLAEHDWFGLPQKDRHIFCQATMWAVDPRFERILLESPSSLFLGPDGHGGMLAALARTGCLADAQQRGLTQFFYGQIDNPLLQVCDELLLGSHILAGSEMTTQVVQKRDPLERVGNVVSVDGKVQVIEYSDLPDELARGTNPDGSLKLWAGNLAVHVFDVAFLARCAQQRSALPFHYARKKVRCLDDGGNIVEPAEPNAIRFERFIFDLLPLAERALVVEADPAEAFAPVKNSDSEPTDNASTARAAMMARDRRLLRAAGATASDDVPVEINPLFASTADELRTKLPPGTVVREAKYFAP
jgi:UDP-N-acetylglucosamine/UDP-N-acetylgalactosamine diphosphorylase